MIKRLAKKLNLTAVLILFVFFIMLASVFIISGATFLLSKFGVIDITSGRNIHAPIILMLVFSILLGTGITALISRRTLRPLREVIAATKQVAAGDFTVELESSSVPEINDLTNSFNTMVRELAGIETLRSDFIGNFSHEFKTPIVSIRGFAKLLKDESLSAREKTEYIDIIVEESERLVNLSSNVLTLSKLENIEIVTEKETFALDEQIRRAVLLLEPHWREKEISPALELAGVEVYSNPDLLHQVWINLLDNAIKFSEPRGAVRLFLRQEGEHAVVVIEDDGCGMDQQTMARLFDKFYQGEVSHTNAGNGLGLALVKRIVDLCEGTVIAQNIDGGGSRFTVQIKASESP